MNCLRFKGRIAYCISDREDAGIEYTDDVAGVSFLNDRAILGHQLLRLREAHLLVSLHMKDFLVLVEAARTDSHESDSVSVGTIHVGLNLKYKGREMRIHRIDQFAVSGLAC